MHTWFQNLNKHERRRHWLNVRGHFGLDWDRVFAKYQLCTGPNLRLELEDDEGSLQITVGFILGALYLTLPWIKMPRRMIDRHWGFYIYEWTLVFFWGGKVHESGSKDPWWWNVHLNLPDILFGSMVHFEQERAKAYAPRTFWFRGKRFEMDSIEICLGHWFRPRIPMSIWCKKVMRMHLEIKKPPLHAGKGENEWDCGDDGSFGMCASYDGPNPREDYEGALAHCCLRYCESVHRDIKRRGRAMGDEAPIGEFGFLYSGREPDPDDPQGATIAGSIGG